MKRRSRSASESHSEEQAIYQFISKRQVMLSMVCITLALLLAALSQTIVATTLPLIIADVGGFDRYVWAATSYMISATIAYPIVGRLSDIYGRRVFMVLGLIIFIVSSILVGLSASLNQVVVFRMLQGIGGGIIMTCSYVAIADLFPPEDRGNYQGLIGAVYGVAIVVGPVLGGLIADLLTWHWAFILNGVAGLPVLILTLKVFPKPRLISKDEELDFPGIATLILALVPLLLSLSSAGVVYDWISFEVIVLLSIGILMSFAFIMIELKSNSPIMPLEIFRQKAFTVSVCVTLLTSFGLYGSVIFLPLFFQAVLGLSVTASGNLLVPMLLAMVFGGILFGQFLSRVGEFYRLYALINTGTMSVGMLLMSTMDSSTSVTLCLVYIVVVGFGFGGSVTTLSVAVANNVNYRMVGVASSALQFYRSLGGLLGLTLLGATLAHRFSLNLNDNLSEKVRSSLPQEQIETILNDPLAHVDESGAHTLKTEVIQDNPDSAVLVDELLNSMTDTLSGSINELFYVITTVTVLSFVISFQMLKMRNSVTPTDLG